MSRVKVFKVLIQDGDNCLRLMRYLDNNILAIKRLGVRVLVEKFTEDDMRDEVVEALYAHGITSFPAITSKGQKPIVGYKSIINMFEMNIHKGARGGGNDGMRDPNDLSSYMNQEIFGRNSKGDLEDDEDDHVRIEKDIMSKMRQYEKKVPRHRSTKSHEIDIAGRRGGVRAPVTDDEDLPDNIKLQEDDSEYIDAYDEPRPSGGRQSAATAHGGAIDQDAMMLEAWMNNNPSDGGGGI